ncbi:MAG: T9SS type A sorting domain-containing protein [Bacteroidetes bacterium]|nr:T9SS type A sorting domain-containing protein [Bacteroidota bacterium]
MKKMIYSLALMLSIQIGTQAQPNVQWQKNYGGNNAERATATKQTSDGGYIVAGYTLSDNGDVVGHKNGEDYWVLKLNNSGNVVWKKIYGGNNDDRCYDVQQTSDGGYILAGTSNSTDGNISNNKGGFDMWIVKLNASGNITWKKNLGGSDDDAAYSIDELAGGGYVVAGESKSETGDLDNNKGGYDFWIVKLTATGNLVWEMNYGGSSDESAKSVQQCSDGSFIVAGETTSNDYDVSNNKGAYDFWVLRLRPNGTIRWKNTYGGTSQDNAYSVTQIANGNFIVVGETESNNGNVPNNSGGDDFLVMNLKGSGAILWSKTFGGESHENARFVRETTDGAVVVAGKTESNSGDVTNPKGGHDFWVIKVTKSSGNLEWQKTLGGFDNDFAYGIDVTADGAQVVVGASESDDGDLNNNKGNADFWIVKLGVSGQRVLAAEAATSREMIVYPNPASTFVNVAADGLNIEQINVVSIEGKMVSTVMPNAASYQLDVSNLPKGAYFLKLTLEDGMEKFARLMVD